MSLSRPFILRPVATTLTMVALLIAGMLGYRWLPVAALPQVDYPTMQVVTLYPGASPDVMAALVTSPLERQFGQIAGLKQMSSSSSGGASRITLQFDLDLSMAVAEQDVQAAITAASNLLPNDLPAPPLYNKVNPADTPVVTLAVTSPTLPLTEVRDLLNLRVVQKLAQINGVGLVSLAGGQRPAVRVQVDPQALAAHGLSLRDVRQVISTANVNQPVGTLDGDARSITIRANEQLRSVAEYERLILHYNDEAGSALRLGDVATIREAAEDERQAAWFGDQPAILINIQRQPGANVIEVADKVIAQLPELTTTLPTGIDVAVAADRTHTIRDSVKHVQRELLLAVALVVLVTFVFLRTFTATLIPSVVVPLSLVGTFAIMAALGFSINNLTLMALTIATGFVVDDAIVMIENIVRFMEKGDSAFEAALKGAAQIGFTLVSLTVSLIAVLIPLLFMSDVIGRLFREFALTLAVAILLSLFISLTLTPMMCARLLRQESVEPSTGSLAPSASRYQRLTHWLAQQMDRVVHAYDRGLHWVLAHQGLTLVVAIATFFLTAGLYLLVPKGFFPAQDTGIIQLITTGPQDASFTAMSRLQEQAARRLLAQPGVNNVTSFIGVDGSNAALNTGRMQVNLQPAGERDNLSVVMADIQQAIDAVPGLMIYQQPVQELSVDDQLSRYPYQMALSDPDPVELERWLPRWVEAMQNLPAIEAAASDFQPNGRQLVLDINRDTAARLGVTKAAIDDALYDAFGQRQISTIYTQSAQYRVVLEVEPHARQMPENVLDLPISTRTGATVPLRTLASWREQKQTLSIDRLDQFPAANVSFSLAAGSSLSEAIEQINTLRLDIGLPDAIELRYLGAAQAFEASLSSTLWLLLAAVVTMYIVLGILYESYIHPITILSTLPSAAIGALLALLLAGYDLDLVGIIGIILLIGIVKKNAIMMIDFALVAQRERRLSPQAAIHEAALLRFRPILMTTFAALFSALPLMFATGTGAELRQPLGLVMVGGLICSQVLTLFTTPVIYLYFDRLLQRRESTVASESV